MTTIAFKDGIIAADGLACIGDTIVSRTEEKVWVGGRNIILAITGCLAASREMALRIDESMPKEEGGCMGYQNICNVWTSEMSGRVIALRHNPDGGIIILEFDGIQYPAITECEPDQFYAWGSGMGIALGAMDAGASARRAVSIASKYDTGTGGKIICIDTSMIKVK